MPVFGSIPSLQIASMIVFAVLIFLTKVACAASLVQLMLGCVAVCCHAIRAVPGSSSKPPMTILKPVHGLEPLLEEALASFFVQDYPGFQIVFGVQDPQDPALMIIRRLAVRFAHVEVVIDTTKHGLNRKVSNLINMEPMAKHAILVVSDSDMHVKPDYLARVATELARDGVGLVTSIYGGRGVGHGLVNRLGVAQLNAGFLPGVLLGRMFGREDCLGATMDLRRRTLDAVGGFQALVAHLANDHRLGQLIAARGETVALVAGTTAITVPEQGIAALFLHELPWGRTIHALAPVSFAGSALQHPIVRACVAAMASGFPPWTAPMVGVAWLARWIAARCVEAALQLDHPTPFWLLPIRDALSVTVIAASFGGDTVERAATARDPRSNNRIGDLRQSGRYGPGAGSLTPAMSPAPAARLPPGSTAPHPRHAPGTQSVPRSGRAPCR